MRPEEIIKTIDEAIEQNSLFPKAVPTLKLGELRSANPISICGVPQLEEERNWNAETASRGLQVATRGILDAQKFMEIFAEAMNEADGIQIRLVHGDADRIVAASYPDYVPRTCRSVEYRFIIEFEFPKSLVLGPAFAALEAFRAVVKRKIYEILGRESCPKFFKADSWSISHVREVRYYPTDRVVLQVFIDLIAYLEDVPLELTIQRFDNL